MTVQSLHGGEVSNGKLGTVISSDVYTPAQVWKGESDTDTWYLENVIKISAGSEHSAVINNRNEVYTWGKILTVNSETEQQIIQQHRFV